jgi:2'-hydroxyisoflavone reductase
MASRREFLASLAAAGAVGAVAVPGISPAAPARANAQGRSLRILILGGTGFSGPHLVARALERGHSVTTFSRGRTDPPVHAQSFRDVEQLIGDRATDLSALGIGTWDAVIDNSGFRESWTGARGAGRHHGRAAHRVRLRGDEGALGDRGA